MQEGNTTNPLNQPVNNSVPVVEQPKQSNFLIILLSVLLFISVSIAGFFAYQTQKLVKELTLLKSDEKVAVATVEPTIEPVATESSEVDSATNWKLYNNTNLKISFKFPSDWTIRGFAGDQANFQATEATFSRFILESADNKISFSFQKPFFEGSFDPCYSKMGTSENVAIGNEKFAKHTYECVANNSKIVYLVSEPHNYSIVIVQKNENTLDLLINQLLSTFKFTN